MLYYSPILHEWDYDLHKIVINDFAAIGAIGTIWSNGGDSIQIDGNLKGYRSSIIIDDVIKLLIYKSTVITITVNIVDYVSVCDMIKDVI
jgi:hypothetical protein